MSSDAFVSELRSDLLDLYISIYCCEQTPVRFFILVRYHPPRLLSDILLVELPIKMIIIRTHCGTKMQLLVGSGQFPSAVKDRLK